MIKEHNVDSKFLDVAMINEGETIQRVSYLADVRVKPSNNGQDYGVCKFKDINGNFITGFFFDLDAERKMNLLGLKKKAVTISFIGSQYNGLKTVNLINVKQFTGEFPFNKFIGEVEGVEEKHKNIENIFSSVLKIENIKLPQSYKNASLSNVYGGKVGGYVKYLECVLYRLLSMEGIEGVNVPRLVEILYKVQNIYYNYLNRLTILEVIPMKDRVEYLFKAHILADNEVFEILEALINGVEPETIDGVLLYTEMNKALDILEFSPVYDSMVVGSKYNVKLGDKRWDLTKY